VTAASAFLLSFSALFSIINPIGGALIFNEVTQDLSAAAKRSVAGRVGLYSLLILLGALWGGAFVLNFFGISLAALRIAGGTVVALSAWNLLMSRNGHDDRQHHQAAADPADSEGDPMEMAFFPLTMPYTTGPGTIAVAIALGAVRPASGGGLLDFFLGVSYAAVANALIIWIGYRYADQVTGWMSATARNIVARLIAFLLLCIGVQILVTGVGDAIGDWRALQPTASPHNLEGVTDRVL
jgi:multiple antibiotic resistance protein